MAGTASVSSGVHHLRRAVLPAAIAAAFALPGAGALAAQVHAHPRPAEQTDSAAEPMSGDSSSPGQGMTGRPGPPMPARPFGIPMTRMGSGTSWLPDASPMRAYHFMPGRWTLMVHGDVDGYYDHQGSRRGDDQVGSTNWAMLMAMRAAGPGMLHLHAMLSAEPLTVGGRGHPLLLQTGETHRGAPLRDRQHPHDLFMELSARYEVPLTRRLGVSLHVAPVGEPAIGPVAYMHRTSAQSDPFAPLGHQCQDATHNTYVVLNDGVFTRTVQLEGTLFQGREPDDDRYDFDFGGLDSYGARLTVNPSSGWSLAASYGYLESPEALAPEENQHRLGASILHTRRFGPRGDWSSALVYGANRHTGPGQPAHGFAHSLLVESNLQLDDANSLFGRAEWVQKSAEELVVPGLDPDTRFDVAAIVLGYVREVGRYGGASLGLGVRGSLNLLPRDLEATYGTRTPAGLALYARLRPALLRHAHPGDQRGAPDKGMTGGDMPEHRHDPAAKGQADD
jgi:hypothetical protein